MVGTIGGGIAGFFSAGFSGSGGWDWDRAWAGASSGAMVGAGIGLMIDTWGASTPLSTALVGAGLGAGIGSAFGGGLLTTRSVDWRGWGRGAVTGAVAGFTGGYATATLAPFMGCGALGNFAGGFAIGAGSDALGQGASMALGLQDQFSVWQMLFSGGMGGALQYLMRACFSAGTPLLWEFGSKPIETFKPGDRLWARSEFDPNGELDLKKVEEVFVRVAPILHVHVRNQVIRTTSEHPFYVYNKGWIPASAVAIGDLFSSHDGQWIAVEDLLDTGEYETVYNLRVADWHTYFVGGEDWNFSVWAHNANPADYGVPSSVFRPNSGVSSAYKRPSGAGPTAAQTAAVQGKPCVVCGTVTSRQIADHIDPLVVQFYRDGAVNVANQSLASAIQSHCLSCSRIQGGYLSNFSKWCRDILGL